MQHLGRIKKKWEVTENGKDKKRADNIFYSAVFFERPC
jgi:hypothetical protein